MCNSFRTDVDAYKKDIQKEIFEEIERLRITKQIRLAEDEVEDIELYLTVSSIENIDVAITNTTKTKFSASAV